MCHNVSLMFYVDNNKILQFLKGGIKLDIIYIFDIVHTTDTPGCPLLTSSSLRYTYCYPYQLAVTRAAGAGRQCSGIFDFLINS